MPLMKVQRAIFLIAVTQVGRGLRMSVSDDTVYFS
jgi:hypothetical protein